MSHENNKKAQQLVELLSEEVSEELLQRVVAIVKHKECEHCEGTGNDYLTPARKCRMICFHCNGTGEHGEPLTGFEDSYDLNDAF